MCVFIHGRAGRGGAGNGRAGRLLRVPVDDDVVSDRAPAPRDGVEGRGTKRASVRVGSSANPRRRASSIDSRRLRVCVTKEGVSSADDSSEKSANNAPHQRPEFEARSRSGRSGAGDRGRAGLRRRRRQLELILEINTKMPSRPTKVSATSDRDNVLFIPRRALGASPSPSPPIRFRSDPIPRERAKAEKKKKRARATRKQKRRATRTGAPTAGDSTRKPEVINTECAGHSAFSQG